MLQVLGWFYSLISAKYKKKGEKELLIQVKIIKDLQKLFKYKKKSV